ncbi:MAG: pantoate--beta-alanine ligase [Gemmatimonadetes bacterium]|nr:pantoate--beta-alanine ligase [Gemmatimonadota bacterium]
MLIARTIAELRAAVREARARGRPIGFVPTMGALHEGHLSLVDRARERGAWVVLSIYVNPLQFGPAEDFQRYPRDFEGDCRLAEGRGVECVFAPSDAEMVPLPPAVTVVPRALADCLCGRHRPGHFEGVLTVVAKLFHIVEPDIAVFGQKDFHQSVLVRRMVRDLNFPIEIDVAPILRDSDGLARSSRNRYLGPDDRRAARSLSRALAAVVLAFRGGERRAERLRAEAQRVLASAVGVRTEYVEIVHPETLEAAERAAPEDVCAIAAHLGSARLIDNVILGAPDAGLVRLLVPGAEAAR